MSHNHQQVSENHPENQVPRKNLQSGPLAENPSGAHRAADSQKEVAMDWPHAAETCWQHHTTGLGLESPGKAQGWPPKEDMAEIL